MRDASVLGSVQMFDELFKSIEVFGLKKTMEILHGARADALRLDDENIENVIGIVCRNVGITPYEMLFGRGRKNERIMAIGFCVYYLRKDFEYEPGDIARAVRHDRTICWRYHKRVLSLDHKSVADEKYLLWKENCDREIQQFIFSKAVIH